MKSHKVQTRRWVIFLMLQGDDRDDPCNYVRMNGDANLLFTGAKAYYKGGGWWLISGYAQDGSDVYSVIDKVNDIERRHLK